MKRLSCVPYFHGSCFGCVSDGHAKLIKMVLDGDIVAYNIR